MFPQFFINLCNLLIDPKFNHANMYKNKGNEIVKVSIIRLSR